MMHRGHRRDLPRSPDARRTRPRTPAGRPPDASRPSAGRHETGIPRRWNALDPRFHGVLAGPAHPNQDADGAGV